MKIDLKTELALYSILTYCLLPIAVFYGTLGVYFLLMSLVNFAPQVLLTAFIFFCVIIYTFKSFDFFWNVIKKKKECNRSLFDWIKVNAYVTIFFCVMMLINSTETLVTPSVKKDFIQNVTKVLKDAPKKTGDSLPQVIEMLPMIFSFVIIFTIVHAALLLIHVLLTFRYNKMFIHHFNK